MYKVPVLIGLLALSMPVLSTAVQSVGLNGPKALFHVTKVQQEEDKDWCPDGKCDAIRFTVEGYVEAKDDPYSVEYLLECIETIAHEPSPHRTVYCSRVHARSEYTVEIGTDDIFFDGALIPLPFGQEKPLSIGYTIRMEKEAPRHKR